MKRLVVLLALLGVLSPMGTAHAENAQDVAKALETTRVYESPGVDLLDEGTLESELTGTRPKVYVAALPARAASSDAQARGRAIDIGRAIGDAGAVVLVITAGKHYGYGVGGTASAKGVNAASALKAERAETRAFDKASLTRLVSDFEERVEKQVEAAAGGQPVERAEPEPSSGGSGGTTLLLVLVGLIGGGALLASVSSKRRKARENEGLKADVESLYNRLGSDVSLLNAKDDPVAQQALADASERYNACGSALAMADSAGEFAAARRTAVEGLTAARVARTRLGLDPGPEIPPPPGSGPQLTQEERFELGGQEFAGSPEYQPGRQHYYEGGNVGGRMVRGGWYSAPFWEPFMLGALLSGGFGGGLFGGGGQDSGAFERGYAEGQESASGESGGGGGDWGGAGDWGGGGDFGGGGGDGGGGGGDW
jgi:hypothetical protein